MVYEVSIFHLPRFEVKSTTFVTHVFTRAGGCELLLSLEILSRFTYVRIAIAIAVVFYLCTSFSFFGFWFRGEPRIWLRRFSLVIALALVCFLFRSDRRTYRESVDAFCSMVVARSIFLFCFA